MGGWGPVERSIRRRGEALGKRRSRAMGPPQPLSMAAPTSAPTTNPKSLRNPRFSLVGGP